MSLEPNAMPSSRVDRMSVGDYLATLLKEPKRRRQPEYDDQVRLFTFIDVLAELNPAFASDLLDVWSSSSGGKRSKAAAGKMRAAGQRKGVPDIECMIPVGRFHGFFMEMKAGRNGLTGEQRERMERLAARGYSVAVARSWQEAGHRLCDYLKIPWPDQAEALVELRLQQQREQRKLLRRARRARGGARL